jgi:chaperonin GroES
MDKVRPLHDRVVVRRIEDAETNFNSPIIIPDAAKEKPQEGEVVAVGRGRVNDRGDLISLDVKSGDRVLFGKYAGTEIKIDGVEHLIMSEAEILAVLP